MGTVRLCSKDANVERSTIPAEHITANIKSAFILVTLLLRGNAVQAFQINQHLLLRNNDKNE